jgi:hypothetical protein
LDGLDYYSQYMDIHKIPWFQTTGPCDGWDALDKIWNYCGISHPGFSS